MSEWIKISPDSLIQSHRQHPAEMQFFRSPFDVPTALRATLEPSTRLFKIDFRYIGNEEGTERINVTQRVKFEVGKHSSRLFAIIVDVTDLRGPEELGPVMREAVDRLERRGAKAAKENYDATVEAIEQKHPQILKNLVAASAW